MTYLDLSWNQLTGLPASVGGLAQLTDLDLHNNKEDVGSSRACVCGEDRATG